MRVLMFGWEFPPFNSGGLGTACQGLTKGLSKRNTDVILVLPKKIPLNVDFLKVVFGNTTTENSEYYQAGFGGQYIVNSLLSPYISSEEYEFRRSNTDGKTIKSQQEKISIYGSTLFDEVIRYGSVAGSIAAKENFDVIHAHDWLTFPAGVEAKRVTHKPLVVHVHATEFDRTGGNGVNQQVYDIERYGMHEADIVIAVSNFTKQKIVEHYGVDPNKVKVVHNSVEIENYTLEKASELKRSNKIVLFLGRLTLQKGPEYFVRTAKKVLERYPDVIFVVAGSGDMDRQIINEVVNLGIADKVLFAGFLRGNDVNHAYQMADLYVMPSVSEPFGIAPLESIMNRTPVLISKQSGVSEVLNHCLKADFWDVDEMTNKILAVLQYPELYECLRDNSFREVQSWTWEEPAQKCINIYNEVVAR